MGVVAVKPAMKPLRPPRKYPVDEFVLSPFTRLARTHALSTAADALVAVALAGSLFFSIPTGEARGKVILYLLLTMAPFALVASLIGPAIDRAKGGRKWVIVASIVVRGVLCGLMLGNLDSLWLFPLAFLVLVAQKGYQVCRTAFVPATVRTDTELVEANSKLALISGLMGFVAAGPGVLASRLFGGQGALVLAIITFAVASVFGTRLPKHRVAPRPVDDAEREELRTAGVLLAASAMALLRGIVGFLTLLVAFDFRGEGHPAWQFGVVAGVSVAGALFGAAIAPRLRDRFDEEKMLSGMLIITLAAAIGASLLSDLVGAAVLGTVVGISSTGGRAAFDSIVQRDAPDANRGRSFARFETRFQLVWVVGALLPVAIKMPASIGFLVVAAVAGFATFSYLVGSTAARHRSGEGSSKGGDRAVQIEERMSSVSTEVTGRVSGAAKAVGRRFGRDRQPPAPPGAGEPGPAPPPPPGAEVPVPPPSDDGDPVGSSPGAPVPVPSPPLDEPPTVDRTGG